MGTWRSEQALVHGCLANDQDACTELVDRYHRMVHALVWRTTRDDSCLDDLVQETFMRVFGGLPQFGGRSKLSTWICSIACRVALDHKRSSTARAQGRTFVWARNESNVEANPEDLLVRREAAVMLREEMEGLADRYRLPLMHVAIGELRYDAVSRLLGVPIGTVKANVFYAKGMLRHRLQQRLVSP